MTPAKTPPSRAAKAGSVALAVIFIAFVAAMLVLIVIGFGKMVLS